MDEALRKYMAEIGRRGGTKSRRTLSSEEARALRQRRTEKERSHKPQMTPHCLKCGDFDREALECRLEKCKGDPE